MIDTKKLRQRILDLAIRGKLVPQDPNDEPASVLLDRIRAEKERLIAEGKINRSKTKKTATDDKSHYPALPQGWAWSNIGEYLLNRDGERIPVSSAIRSKQKNKIYDYYGAAGVIDKVDSYLFDERLLLVGEDGANLLSRSKDNAFFAEGKYWVNNHAHVLDAIDKCLLEYVALVINSQPLDDYITGSAQPKLSQDNLNSIPLAIPPYEEQLRIISAVKSLFAIVEGLENEISKISENIDTAKSKILELAITGKLVPQNPEDEPASELLKRINPKAEIVTDNEHYPQLPDNWVICRLGGVVNVVNGRNQSEVVDDNGQYPIYGSGGIIGRASAYLSLAGSTIIGRKGTINNPLFVSENFWNVDTAFGMKPIEGIDDRYFFYFCKYFDFTSLNKSTTLPSLTKTNIEGISLPIPPMQEQIRIVAKVEQLFKLLNNICE